MADTSLQIDIGANIGEFKTKIKAAGMDIEGIQKAVKTSFDDLNKLAKKYPGYFDEALGFAKEFEKTLNRIANQKGPVTLKQQARIDAAAGVYTNLVKTGPAKSKAAQLAEEKRITQEKKAQEKATKQLEAAEAKQAAAREKAAKAEHGNIVRARYALYDMANEGRRVGLIMVGLGIAAAKVGGDFEKSFKNVERTTGLTGGALENLRKTLVEISQTSPVSFKDITSIATLGAQMGIASGGVDEFASTVSKFSAVTGVAVDTAAMSFGRIAQLLKVSSSEYENLASAVLYAGRNSIATEEQILTLTSQIAASANQAGFATSEVIGLATALASLGVPPEQARGVILRLFADFDRVVSEGGKTLGDYAALMGTTSDSIKNLWESNPAQFFTGFTDALGKTGGTAAGVNNVLAALGITETREVQVLQKLSGNQDLLKKSMEDSGASYASNTDLSEQYGIQTDNLNDKIIKLGNNLLALSAAIGGTVGIVLKPIIDLLTGLVQAITNNPIATAIGAISLVLTAGAGIFLLYKAAVAQAMATLFAMRTTLKELGVEGVNTTISMAGLRSQLLLMQKDFGIVNIGAAKTALSIGGIKNAAAGAVTAFARFIPQMAVIAAGMAVVATATKIADKNIADLRKNIDDVVRSGKSFNEIDLFNPQKTKSLSIERLGNELSDFQVDLKQTSSFMNTFADSLFSLAGMGEITTLSLAKKDISAVDDAMAKLVADGKINEAAALFEKLKAQADKVGVSQKQLSDEFLPNYTAALEGAIPATNDLADSELEAAAAGENLADIIKTRLIDSMIGGTAQQAKFVDSIVNFSEALATSKGSISAWSANGRKALASFEDLLTNIAAMSGNDMATAIQMTAAAIKQIELAGGSSAAQVQGLVLRINSLYGLNLNGSTVTSIAQLQALIASTGNIAAGTKAQIQGLLSGGSYAELMKQAFDAAKKSINSAGSAVKKQIRTIKTYASEISGLFSDIYDRAYSLTTATDSFDSGWQSIKNRVDDAKQSVIDLNDELNGMTADRGVLQYQLDTATKYGDTLRANKLRAQIAKLDSDITKKTEEKTKAQAESTLALTGNTEAARANREELRAQVKDAGDLIEAYASTAKANGKLPSKAEVASYAQSVANSFRDQATKIGFAGSELDAYTKIIAGFGTAVKKIEAPNVKVSLDPVTTAVNAYLAEKKETKVNANLGNGNDFLTEIQTFLNTHPLDATLNWKPTADSTKAPSSALPAAGANLLSSGDFGMLPYATATQRTMLAKYKTALADAQKQLALATRAGSYSGVVSANNAIAAATKNIKHMESIARFATGGYVSGPGTSTSDSIMAQLSNGEYVIQASAVDRYGLDFMNALNQMRVGAPAAVSARSATSSSNVVYLSPEDRALLRAASERPIALYTENTKIAQSANAGNVMLAQRGTN